MRPPRTAALVRVAALAALATVGSPAAASADWQITPLVGLTFAGGTSIVDLEQGAEEAHWHFGGAVTWIGEGPVGFEGVFLRTPHFFQADKVSIESQRTDTLNNSYSMALMGNVVLAAPLKWNEYGLRPFVSGGLGVLRAGQEPKETTLFLDRFDANFVGYNVGGGAIGFITDRTGLRFDVRYFRSLTKPETPSPNFIFIGDPRLSYWTGSLGLVLRY